MNLYFRLAIAGVLMAILAGTYIDVERRGHKRGVAEVSKAWEADKAALKLAEDKAVAIRLVENELQERRDKDNKLKQKKDHANEIATIRAGYRAAPGLRINKRICEPGFAASTAPDGAGRSDGGDPATGLLPEPYDRHIKELGQHIEEVFAGCRVAQAFIRSIDAAP